MPSPVYVVLGVLAFEGLLRRLESGDSGHVVPEAVSYVRADAAHWSWSGRCTRCLAVAQAVPPEPYRPPRPGERGPRGGKPRAGGQRSVARRVLVDARLLVPCRGDGSREGSPWPGRPFRGR